MNLNTNKNQYHYAHEKGFVKGAIIDKSNIYICCTVMGRRGAGAEKLEAEEICMLSLRKLGLGSAAHLRLMLNGFRYLEYGANRGCQ